MKGNAREAVMKQAYRAGSDWKRKTEWFRRDVSKRK